MLWDDLASEGGVSSSDADTVASTISDITGDVDKEWWLYIVTFFHAVVINILNIHFKHAATSLTDWENHKTSKQHQYSYVMKAYTFFFFNSYSFLFYVAFVKSTTQANFVHWWVPDQCAALHVRSNCKRDCMYELKYSLAIMFFTILLMNHLLRALRVAIFHGIETICLGIFGILCREKRKKQLAAKAEKEAQVRCAIDFGDRFGITCKVHYFRFFLLFFMFD
jgi:hypothetical protein